MKNINTTNFSIIYYTFKERSTSPSNKANKIAKKIPINISISKESMANGST